MSDPQRHHKITQCHDSTKIEIFEQMKIGRSYVSLTAKRDEEEVELRVLDHLVIKFTPQEALDFAKAFLKVTT